MTLETVGVQSEPLLCYVSEFRSRASLRGSSVKGLREEKNSADNHFKAYERRGAKDHINSKTGGDSRNHRLQNPYAYVLFGVPGMCAVFLTSVRARRRRLQSGGLAHDGFRSCEASRLLSPRLCKLGSSRARSLKLRQPCVYVIYM